jgi:valyl-tRNA synthetase
MPFITEELWQRLPHRGESIVVAPYPRASRRMADPAAEREMGGLIALVSAVRNIRSESRVPPGARLEVTVKPGPEGTPPALAANLELVEALARCRLTIDPEAVRPAGSAFTVAAGLEVFVRLAGVVDLAAERQRLAKELRKADDEIGFLTAKLARPDFRERAPAEVVEREQARLAEQERLRTKLAESLGWIAEPGAPA